MNRPILDVFFPVRFTKNRQPHRVLLTADVVELVKAQEPQDDDDESEYGFAALGGAAVLHRAKKALAEIARVLKIDFRGHDLRRTAATFMAQPRGQ